MMGASQAAIAASGSSRSSQTAEWPELPPVTQGEPLLAPVTREESTMKNTRLAVLVVLVVIGSIALAMAIG